MKGEHYGMFWSYDALCIYIGEYPNVYMCVKTPRTVQQEKNINFTYDKYET